jgi:hypothetical protein
MTLLLLFLLLLLTTDWQVFMLLADCPSHSVN